MNNIVDRTFEIILIGSENAKMTLAPGNILTIADSNYVNLHIRFPNPLTTNEVSFHLSSGSLPPGLYLTLDGVIKGYANKPKLPDDSPTVKTYTFSIQLKSLLGDDLAIYSITVFNQELTQPPNLTIPVILNFFSKLSVTSRARVIQPYF